MEVIQLLVAETNKYYSQYLDTPDNDGRHDCIGDVYLFSNNNINGTCHGHTEKLMVTVEQFYTPFYSNAMKHDFPPTPHILRFLRDNMKKPDKNGNMTDFVKSELSLIR